MATELSKETAEDILKETRKWAAVASYAARVLQGKVPVAGMSAYELWLSQGNTGNVSVFLDSLTGPRGDTGVMSESW